MGQTSTYRVVDSRAKVLPYFAPVHVRGVSKVALSERFGPRGRNWRA